ncbi:MAG: hypothetical protein IPM29_11620 [Planctomycetes bacterium]|nr:hypothetical protein [Planctomycetota bacterium]
MILPILAVTATVQTLVTDKDDYRPGETVYFVGTGFQPGENVAIALQVENYTDTQLDYAIGGVPVDSMGEFTATWIVAAEASDTLITATAIGLQSKRVAWIRFLDGTGVDFSSGRKLGVGCGVVRTR